MKEQKHIHPNDLNKYSFCPMYYQFVTTGNHIHKKALVNQNTRRLFTWAIYQLSSGISKITESVIEEKARGIYGPELGIVDTKVIANNVYKAIQLLLKRIQSIHEVVSSIDIPITVDKSSILCTIDAVVTEETRPITWFVFIDTSEPTFMDEQILLLPNIAIPIMKIKELFGLEEKQIRIAVIRISSNKLIFPKLKYYNNSIWHTFESLVSSFREKHIYRKLSFSCKGCSFKDQCLNGSVNDYTDEKQVSK